MSDVRCMLLEATIHSHRPGTPYCAGHFQSPADVREALGPGDVLSVKAFPTSSIPNRFDRGTLGLRRILRVGERGMLPTHPREMSFHRPPVMKDGGSMLTFFPCVA